MEVILPEDFLREYGSGTYRDYRVLVRGRVTDEVFTVLEKGAVPHINTRFCRDICDDKTATAHFLAENRWPVPCTLG
ncbi:MAG: hypothetical protein LBR47_03585, partial [Spirochaetaceae bacterium]|nr:hypothetical protein [Spirochaetaceae bacterium]